MTATVLYVTDPMCSWCFGFAPVLAGVQAELTRGVTLRMVLGGLAPDSTEPMPEELKTYIQEAWRARWSGAGSGPCASPKRSVGISRPALLMAPAEPDPARSTA